MDRVVWLNGSFVAAADAHVSIFDRGYQLGEGVFATMHAYRGRCFRVERHLAQLADAAGAFGLAVDETLRVLPLDEAAARVGSAEARVRVTITDTAASIVAEPLVPPSPEQYAQGIAVVVVRARRASMPKTTSYAPALLARREATARGADEGIQLSVTGVAADADASVAAEADADANGDAEADAGVAADADANGDAEADAEVACATMANVFVVRGGELATPRLASGCRAGVTREVVLDLAAAAGLRPVERRLSLEELFVADEVFLTNTRIECLPVATLDGRALRRGPHGSALRAALRKRAGA